jgi:hypothetical protein
MRAIVLLLCWPAIAAAGKLTLVAGGGTKAGDCPATEAKLAEPFAVEFNRYGTMFIAEHGGHRIVKVDPAGRLTVFAGVGEAGDLGDGGPALKARFRGPHSIAIAADGVVYVADTLNHKVRRIDLLLNVSRFAGSGRRGFSGDGGPADKADFASPHAIALDPTRNRLIIAVTDNRCIRVVELWMY